MFVTGPDVVKTVTNEAVTQEELGGADTHASKSGVAHFACDDDLAAISQVRDLLSFLPSSNREAAPVRPTEDPRERASEALNRLVPDDANTPYDMAHIVSHVVDEGEFLEVSERAGE